MNRICPLAVLMVLSPLPAIAQSVYGPGGLFLNPTAAMAPAGQIEPSVLALRQHYSGTTSKNSFDATWLSSAVDYGLRPNVEIGAAVAAVAGLPGGGNPSFGGYAKYRLFPETGSRPAAAVGLTILGFGQTNFRAGFAALRKSSRISGLSLAGDLGLQYVDVSVGKSRHSFQPYAGAELGFARGWTFTVEARPRLYSEIGTPLALTLIHRVRSGYQIAVTWANNGAVQSPGFGVGAGLTLGSR